MKVKTEFVGSTSNIILSNDTGQEAFFQMDWDYPMLAGVYGYIPCKCGYTDGTVDCKHKTVDQMLSEAASVLEEHDGEWVKDSGYYAEILAMLNPD